MASIRQLVIFYFHRLHSKILNIDIFHSRPAEKAHATNKIKVETCKHKQLAIIIIKYLHGNT